MASSNTNGDPRPIQSSELLRAVALSKEYRTESTTVMALKEVDFSLYTGELVVVLGPSGSGKSTLVNILGTLDRPTAGEVWFKNQNLFIKNDEQLALFRKHHVGLVFQFYNLIPTLTALENVELMAALCEDAMSPEEALQRLQLWERRNHFPGELSGGEQQRVAIARAIVKKPTLLLCDEPTGALDVETGILVLEAIEKVHHEMGVSVILITHNETIAHLSDRTVRMSGGKISSVTVNTEHRLARELKW
jgi:putative ABC transport system ATP-binding protein